MSLIPKIHTRTSLDIIFYAKIMETCWENARKLRKIKISNVKRRQTRKSLPDSEAAYTIYSLKNCISEFEAWEFDEISRFLSHLGTVAGETNSHRKKIVRAWSIQNHSVKVSDHLFQYGAKHSPASWPPGGPTGKIKASSCDRAIFLKIEGLALKFNLVE